MYWKIQYFRSCSLSLIVCVAKCACILSVVPVHIFLHLPVELKYAKHFIVFYFMISLLLLQFYLIQSSCTYFSPLISNNIFTGSISKLENLVVTWFSWFLVCYLLFQQQLHEYVFKQINRRLFVAYISCSVTHVGKFVHCHT